MCLAECPSNVKREVPLILLLFLSLLPSFSLLPPSPLPPFLPFSNLLLDEVSEHCGQEGLQQHGEVARVELCDAFHHLDNDEHTLCLDFTEVVSTCLNDHLTTQLQQ